MLCAGGILTAGRVAPTPATATAAVRWSRTGAAQPAGDVLLGLVDFGNGCGQAGYPGVYVRVADPAVADFLRTDPAQAAFGGLQSRGVRAGAAQRAPPPSLPAARADKRRCHVLSL